MPILTCSFSGILKNNLMRRQDTQRNNFFYGLVITE
jgi:hypothetical protein